MLSGSVLMSASIADQPGSGSFTRPISRGELGALCSERGQVGLEYRTQEAAIFNTRGANDFPELQATQAGGDHVLCRHARDCAEVEPLALVELCGHHAGAGRCRRRRNLTRSTWMRLRTCGT